jgi:hypothetical protein
MRPIRHCEHKSILGAAIQRDKLNFLDCFVVILLAMTLLISPAHAKDKKLDEILEENAPSAAGYYAPDFCDFEITFPEKPHTARRCPQGTNKCYEIQGYTFVYDLQTTIDVTANCAPSTPANYTRYNEDVIKSVLTGMVKRADIQSFEINTRELETARQGSLLGTGTYGKQERIYNAQIWVGQNSVLTIEAKLVGQSHEKADETFADILASIGVKAKKAPK